MPKSLNYDDEDLCFLAEILINKAAETVKNLNKQKGICRADKKKEIAQKISKAKIASKLLKKNLKGLKENHNDTDRNKMRLAILEVFDNKYKCGSDSRNRITARIRKERGKRNKTKLIPININQGTNDRLRDLKKKKGITDRSFDKIITLLLDNYCQKDESEDDDDW